MKLEHLRKQVASYLRSSEKDSDGIVRVFASREHQDDFSSSSGHLRAILTGLEVGSNLGKVVILGSGEGGWPKVVATEYFTSERIHSYLWWKNHERPGLAFHDDRVTVLTENIGSVSPYKCDTLLCDMQPGSIEQELTNLSVLERWLALGPRIFAIRIVNYKDERILARLKILQKLLKSGRLIGTVVSEQAPIEAVYYVQGEFYSIREDSEYLASKIGAISDLGQRKFKVNGKWPIPDELPEGVEQLAPLDMGATLEAYVLAGRGFHPPKGGRNYLKELGWVEKRHHEYSDDFFKSPTIEKLIESLEPLIENYDKWLITTGDPDTIDRTIREKIDHAPKENHNHHEYLWTTYKAVAMYLRDLGCRVYRFNDMELFEDVNKQSSIGWQDRESADKFEFSIMGEYLQHTDEWKSNVEEFRVNLLAGRPIKGDYNSSGKKEVKKENRTRVVWSLCATGRLYEAQVLGSADNLLKKLPYSIYNCWAQDYGEVFEQMLNHKIPRNAVCDDIKGWDSKVSYSMLCMEAAFLQLMSDDEDHRNEIKHLYRLYAYAVVNLVEAYWDTACNEKKFRRVLYQLQGQVASGRRVTYCMNTITNIVVTMSRAAFSQGVKVGDLGAWVKERLIKECHSEQYGGMISGDDTVIVLGKAEAKLFAKRGAEFMNDLGFIRKKTGNNKSLIDEDISSIEFCSRRFVNVPMYMDKLEQCSRLIPIRKTEEVLMRKMLREEKPDCEYDLAWAREQGRILLVEYFHVPTIRLFALALLSVTPNNIVLDGENDLGWCTTEKPLFSESSMIEEINRHYFGLNTGIKSDYRARCLEDLGYISAADRKQFDLNFKSSIYKDWELTLYDRICVLRDPVKPYDDWIGKPKEQFNIKQVILCLSLFVIWVLLLKYIFS